MKLLHTADLHLGDTTYGMDRLDEEYALVKAMVESALLNRVDAVLIAGDVFDNRNPRPQEILVLAQLANDLRSHDVDLIIGSGNHDGTPEIAAWETKTAGWLARLAPERLHAYPAPFESYLAVGPHNSLVHLYSLPYAHKRSFPIEPGSTAADRLERASKALEHIIDELPKVDPHVPNIFMGHFSVLGTFLRPDSSMKISWDVAIRPDVLARFDYAALGHIHRQQSITDSIWYAGRPVQARFDEEGRDCGWLIVEFSDQGRLVDVTPIASNIVRYQTIRSDEVMGWFRQPPTHVRILFPHDSTDANRQSAREAALAQGAASVLTVVEPAPRQERARTEIHADVTPVEGLSRWLSVTGREQEPYLSAGRAMLEGATWQISESNTEAQESPEPA